MATATYNAPYSNIPTPLTESVSNADGLLKEWYTADRVEKMVLGTGPLFGLLPKFEQFGGKRLPIPMIDGNPQGGSATFATAKANKNASSELAFQLTRFRDYALGGIQREAKLASEMGDKGAWLELAKVQVDGIIMTAARTQAINVYQDGTGVRGQISPTGSVTGTSLQLADINTITNFAANMWIQTSATRGGIGTVARTGQAQIIGMDRVNGILYFGANANSLITSIAAGDYICRAGDYMLTFPGLQGWLLTPSRYPTQAGVDNFYSVDRFPDVLRRGGCYHNGTQQSVEEAVIDGQSKAARDGAEIDHLFVNNVQFRQLLKSLQGRTNYVHVQSNARNSGGEVATVSFGGIEFMGDRGPIKVFADFNCPSTKCFGLKLATWKLYSAKAAPHIFDEGTDQMWLRDAGDDTYEVRCGSYSALGSRAPGMNTTIDLAAAV